MPEKNEPLTVDDDGWVVKISLLEKETRQGVILLLHGWTGDENSMWLFAHQLKHAFAFIAPRAPLRTGSTGYGWVPVETGALSSIHRFRPAAEALEAHVPAWLEMLGCPGDEPLSVIGFSQGAALALVYSMSFPQRVEKTACLAGFLPEDAGSVISAGGLSGKSYFVAHGSEDEVIPVRMAKELAGFLQKMGAQVTYCEDAIGHKISANCYKKVSQFFNEAD